MVYLVQLIDGDNYKTVIGIFESRLNATHAAEDELGSILNNGYCAYLHEFKEQLIISEEKEFTDISHDDSDHYMRITEHVVK